MPARILSVDDSRMMRRMIAKALRPFDAVLLEAANGEEGLRIAAAAKPDLILLGVTMPVMNGVTMLRKLRHDPQLNATPVVMVTSESARQDVFGIARFGIHDYVVKPFRAEQLVQRVARVVPLQPRAAAVAA